ncbi:hypothetical protein [Streptomyces sp. NPDC102476]|uniref:hypothetical protein n=1 Tax=Streptomyces sp. NPDC102476 TaxID=3366181 RepID=UPI00381DFA40
MARLVHRWRFESLGADWARFVRQRSRRSGSHCGDAVHDARLPELPGIEGGLVARLVHRWRFESLGAG